MKEFTAKDYLVSVFPAIIVVFIILFVILPKVKDQRENSGTNTKQTVEDVSWGEAVIVLNSGKVEEIFQSHNLDVSLKLADGKIIRTKEPEIDDIFEEVQKCGEKCKNIILATE